MFRSFLRALVAGGALALARADDAPSTWPPSPPVDFAHLPWADGESLSYTIAWGPFYAAEGTFVAQQKSGLWSFHLQLGSRGAVESYYPFRAYFWSMLAPSPWRSSEYGEFRFEPGRLIKERTRIDYTAHLGTREIWTGGKTRTFPIAEDTVDDVGTMLYHLRTGPWQPGDKRLLHVYESDSEKEALAQCLSIDQRAFGTWPVQSLLRIHVLPGKGTHHRGGLMLWMTNDARRLPVHAELDFRYGTFTIDLLKATKATP